MGRKRPKASENSDSEDEQESLKHVPTKRVKQENKENTAQNAMQVVEAIQPASRSIAGPAARDKISANLKSGKIKRVHLENFMCHSNFEVNLNKCVNVIVGLNGSGKSAILTGIAIGLGSRATATSRSSNLRDLVRRGEPTATITITLANDGLDAYDHEVYGDEITVVRTINANTGASSYKIKSEHGRVISTSRQELTKLCMCLNIQVENPVLILNQDAARSFLKECDPKKLYLLFTKATQIEAIIEKLNACSKTASSAKGQLTNLERTVKHLEIDLHSIKDKFDRLKSVRSLRQNCADVKNEIAWLQVQAVEKQLEKVRRELEAKRSEVHRIEDYINNKAKYEKEQKESIRSFGTEFKTLESEALASAPKIDEKRKQYDDENNKLSEFEYNLKNNVGRMVDRIVSNIKQLEEDIAAHEKNPSNVDNLRQENESKIAELERKMADLGLVMDNCKRDFSNFQQSLTDARVDASRVKTILHREQDNVLKVERQIAQYKNASKDKLSAYGPAMSDFIKEIESMHRQGKFSQLPRGPFGRYIDVPRQQYRATVENILGALLQTFAVNNDRDRETLMALQRKKYQHLPNFQIITTEFVHEVYDVSRGIVQLESEGEILLDLVSVSDPVVMNCLIDQRQIERIVVVESNQLAMQLTKERENVPQNLLRVVLTQPMSDFYPAPNFRSYAIREKPVRFIQANYGELVSALQRDKAKQEEKCREIQTRLRDMNEKAKEYERHVADKKSMMNALVQKQREYVEEVKTLRQFEYPEQTDIDFLRKQLEDEKERKIAYEMKVEEAKRKHLTTKDIVRQYKEAYESCLAEGQKIRDAMRRAQIEIENAQRNLDFMKNELATKGRQIASLRNEEAEIAGKVRELEQQVARMAAKIKGKRVTSNRTEEYLQQLIRTAENRIATIESSNENIDEVELLMHNKSDHFNDLKQIQETFGAVMKRLETLRESRFMYVRKLRQHMSLRVKHKFHQVMQLRNYSADIEIDHKDQTLTLKVVPRDKDVDGAVSNTKSLSGGERSYSTVAFLISLWNCVDHAFYFLDEYDVFSDEYNRHMMTMLLLNEAEKRRDKQFGFLTPQDFSNIEAGEFITIHKLRDPERKE